MTSTTKLVGSELQIYLREINQTPLLSAQEERTLGGQIAEGDLDARDRMIRANLRLVVNIARGYLGKGVTLDDLIAEGNLGLIRAVEGFDPAVGVRFSSYACYWIKQSMRNAVVKQGKPVRLPAYAVVLLGKWRRASAVLADRLGRSPSPDEVGDALLLSKRKRGIVAHALRINTLSNSGDDAEENSLEQMLVDERSKRPGDQLADAEEFDGVLKRLDGLKEREARVIRLRFGLGTHDPMTLREIGEALGLTRECIRRIEKQAMRQLTGLC